MNADLHVSVSDDEEGGENGTGGTSTPAPANQLTTATTTTTDFPPRANSVYVAYPRPAIQINGVSTTTLMPSTVGRHNGFLRTYKVLLVGEAGVGKSNLMHRYCYNQYDPTLPSTLGAEFCSREVDIPSGPVGATESVVLQLWDTAGQERNAGVISNAFYRNAVGAIVVYDVARRETLLNVPRWVARVTELAREECVCVVVGAKLDLLTAPHGTPMAKAELEALQQEADGISHALGMRNFLTSALTGEGVLEAFTHLVLAVDAVQAAPPEARRHPQHYHTPVQSTVGDGNSNNNNTSSNLPEMWTAASTVPASPVTLFGSHAAHRRGCEEPGCAVSVAQNSPEIMPSSAASGYTSPGSVGRALQLGSPSSSPVKPNKKKSLDLRGFGPVEGGSATGPTSGGGGASESSWGC
ncbi:guanine nucleotide-binding protein-like protein [Leptomonas pyrrhocoris]|uniref:Guanine nucleotide-binding protein-like protein n=1 Tax=Leptomonas pyrrhocoris TaxID=157538 RepID=A0A0N1J4J0_LEPPY|nr:guanine nucleotide-binding protein-like protein [Leptomonas pyrrhocoris]KPA77258.1 guanine nucleotide-binding protein-like protein [Leptomonas pyrrhocoris]|eukprot:XP_015655697.1 guanine nucleotide-binding protein-like protein [Leptomonas pyrrhocoris]